MPPREEFPNKGLEGAPSDDIGWHFGNPIPGNRNGVVCKLCGKVINGGITRLKYHIAHINRGVAPCPRVSQLARESMMKLLKDGDNKKKDSKRRKDEFQTRLREGDDYEDFIDEDDQLRMASQESIKAQREWEERHKFRQMSGGTSNVYDEGGSSEARLRASEPSLIRSQSTRQQPTVKSAMMKTLRKKLGEAVSKFIIYDRLPMNLVNSPWLHNLLNVAAEVGRGVKCPTPYEVSEVYLEEEYQSIKNWIESLKGTWKERGVTIMCDGWTNSINHMHIINFLVYSCRGTIFLKSVDASNVSSRNTDYYFKLLDEVVEEVGEEYVVQIITDNEKALKAAGLKLMEKRPHLFWSSCAAHCLDLCLEDIGKKSNVKKVLEDAKLVTSFIYNHIWTVNLMKKFNGGREIIRPAITRFATQFIQVESILKQKDALRNMFNSAEYRSSKWGKEKSGPSYDAKKIVLGSDFWAKASDIVKVYDPIVKVLRLVDGDEKPTMGFLYEAIDRAKQCIQKTCRYHTQYNDIVDQRWRFMHSDLHSAGYYLNPQFQFGLLHGNYVIKETLEDTRKVITRLEPDVDNQIKAINQLLLFRDKEDTFGSPQAQRAWSQMNPAEWWIIYGMCAPELQTIAVKVLSQTTSSSNCERNWSTFSYIHTKTRNRLKYLKLQKLVYTFYNMKLKMRHTMRRSQEEMERDFNPISLDYIFYAEDPLAAWLEERETPLLDGIQNEDWLPREDSDDEHVVNIHENESSQNQSSGSDDGGLSPPSDNDDDDDDDAGGTGGGYSGGIVGDDQIRRGYRNLNSINEDLDYNIDYTRGESTSSTRRGQSHSRRRKQHQSLSGGSSSIGTNQNFNYSDTGDSFDSQGYMPSQSYHPPPFMNYPTHTHFPPEQQNFYYPPHFPQSQENFQYPSHYPQPQENFQYPSHYPQPQLYPSYASNYQNQSQSNENAPPGLFNYLFEQGSRPHGGEEDPNFEPPRHSTMW